MKKERFKLISAVHLFLIKDQQILLSRRFHTGYEDGNYSVVAGHLDGNETATSAMIREAREEAGIIVRDYQLRMVHVMHKKLDDERIDFFFEATEWEGEVKNMEPHKCDDLCWFPLNQLPANMVPYVRVGVENYTQKVLFSEFGWD
ncbi:MAG: NUDIX domain-containing protein [Candidatus Uhrbacteria bacterium]|nr:NUDIX domain-containing protein [Candidatus Uhrbacteria bacterium]